MFLNSKSNSASGLLMSFVSQSKSPPSHSTWKLEKTLMRKMMICVSASDLPMQDLLPYPKGRQAKLTAPCPPSSHLNTQLTTPLS